MKISIASDIAKYSRLALGLWSFLHGTITLEQSKQAVSARLRNREKNFLSIVQKGIYQNPKSPYLKLLEIAGCQFGDIESMVLKDGIESTLHKLLKEGVYISWEEFKGKKEIVRGGRHFQFTQKDFDNPYLPACYEVRSSGSRSAGTRSLFDLSNQVEKCYHDLLMFAANNTLDFPVGVWHAVLPSGTGIGSVLRGWKTGKPVAKWFSPVNFSQIQTPLRDRLATEYIIYVGRLFGARLVRSEYVSLNEAVKVAQWMAATKKQFGSCSMCCSVSPAVKVCQAAVEHGIDIQSTRFFVGGEPLTEAKRQQIDSAGALVTPRYVMSEVGRVGIGCPRNGTTDGVHLLYDSTALIQHERRVGNTDILVNAFIFTSLLPAAPKILLNVESDDYGVKETRSCGCIFEQLGFNQHLYNIRSYAKLTGSGVTIVGSDMVRIMEEVLPQRYGGAATDYQLLEEEDAEGKTILSLIISPNVEAVDESDVIATVLDRLYRDIYSGKTAAELWSQMSTLRVKRMYPISLGGKIPTLHIMKKK